MSDDVEKLEAEWGLSARDLSQRPKLNADELRAAVAAMPSPTPFKIEAAGLGKPWAGQRQRQRLWRRCEQSVRNLFAKISGIE